MNKKFLFLIVSFSLFFAGSLSARDVINFNKGWTLSKLLSNVVVDEKVDLPHVWDNLNSDHSFSSTRGCVVYNKEFRPSSSWATKLVYLRFKGVATTATLFVNGQYVGKHSGAFTAFTFDISPYLNFSSVNTITVNVDNSQQFNVFPLCSDNTIYGGIYRDVELIVTEKLHVSTTHHSSEGVYVTQRSLSNTQAEVDVDVMLTGQYGEKGIVKVSLMNNGKEIAAMKKNLSIGIDGEEKIHFPFTVKEPRLWNGSIDPFTYQCKVVVQDIHDAVSDNVTVDFGLRNISVDRSKGFMLNGKSYPLKGVAYYQDMADTKSALSNINRLDDIETIEEMGATAIRCIGGAHDKYLYDLTDRKGIITWVDMPITGMSNSRRISYINNVDLRDNGIEQLEDLAYQLYNHPSIAFVGLFSNIASTSGSSTDYIQELFGQAKSLMPNALTVACSNQDGSINNITDVISWSQYFGWYNHVATDVALWIDGFANSWKNLKPAIGEYGAGGVIGRNRYKYSTSEKVVTDNTESSQFDFHLTYLKALKGKSYIWGSFVNSIFEFGTPDGVSSLGLVSYDRYAKKDAFYLYKANWNKKEQFIHIAGKRDYQKTGNKQNLTVISNCAAVDLKINGVTHSTVTVTDGVAKWSNLNLNYGENIIEAVCGKVKDSASFQVYK